MLTPTPWTPQQWQDRKQQIRDADWKRQLARGPY